MLETPTVSAGSLITLPAITYNQIIGGGAENPINPADWPLLTAADTLRLMPLWV